MSMWFYVGEKGALIVFKISVGCYCIDRNGNKSHKEVNIGRDNKDGLKIRIISEILPSNKNCGSFELCHEKAAIKSDRFCFLHRVTR